MLKEKLNRKDASELTLRTIKILAPFKEWMKTITTDNGKEFAGFVTKSAELNLDFYFTISFLRTWLKRKYEWSNKAIFCQKKFV